MAESVELARKLLAIAGSFQRHTVWPVGKIERSHYGGAASGVMVEWSVRDNTGQQGLQQGDRRSCLFLCLPVRGP